MEKHVKGGVKVPQSSSKIAIPIEENVTRRKGGAKAGAINKSLKPKTVMGNKGYIFTANGTSFLARRRGRKGAKKQQVLYALKPTATIKGGYNPERAVRRGMNQFFAPMMKRAMIRALKTAKLR